MNDNHSHLELNYKPHWFTILFGEGDKSFRYTPIRISVVIHPPWISYLVDHQEIFTNNTS